MINSYYVCTVPNTIVIQTHSEPRQTSKMERLSKIVNAASYPVGQNVLQTGHIQTKFQFDLEALNTK